MHGRCGIDKMHASLTRPQISRQFFDVGLFVACLWFVIHVQVEGNPVLSSSWKLASWLPALAQPNALPSCLALATPTSVLVGTTAGVLVQADMTAGAPIRSIRYVHVFV
jgi:hypothetical protein